MPSFNCKDAGVECDFKVEAKTQDKLLKKITKHAKKAHDMDPIPDDMLQKVKGAIKA
jgi:predicted small metal-binding protein